MQTRPKEFLLLPVVYKKHPDFFKIRNTKPKEFFSRGDWPKHQVNQKKYL